MLRRRDREAAGLFLAEGPQAVREAVRARAVRTLFVVDPAATAAVARIVAEARAAGMDVRLAAAADVAAISDTVAPQGLVAVCHVRPAALGETLISGARLVVCAASVRDPGNAGTLVRCADAFGADAVLVTTESVDPYNAKAVRASAGSLFHLPVVTGAGLTEVVEAAHGAGLQVLAADGSGSVDLGDSGLALGRPTLWVLGNEAWGLPSEHLALADAVVRIRIHGRAESLNLAAAAAVCLYASATALHR